VLQMLRQRLACQFRPASHNAGQTFELSAT
jgi:hypothetical protein